MKGLRGKTWWVLVICCYSSVLQAAGLTVQDVVLDPNTLGSIIVSGDIPGESTFGYTIQIEIIPRAGNLGTVTFTSSPPSDVVQLGDPWSGVGTFSDFDTDTSGSILFNGAVDDNGTFLPGVVIFSGDLAEFPIVAGAGAAGVWDVTLSTSVGNSSWEGLSTTLSDGTITVTPDASLTAIDLLMPPDAVSNVEVSGQIMGLSTFGLTLQVELVPRAGATGTVVFTPAPPEDIVQLGDPWPGTGTFSFFDTDSTGSTTLNGSVDDNGTFLPTPVIFAGPLARFPVTSSVDADGMWDILLLTSAGNSSWEGPATFLTAGTLTVTPTACVIDTDCDDTNPCTDDACSFGICSNTNNTASCDDGIRCTENDVCAAGVCAGTAIDCTGLDDACNAGVCNPVNGLCEPSPANEGGFCDDADLCTQNDLCTAGVCAGSSIDCSGLDDTCNTGTCNPASGLCEPQPANESGPCDDGDLCTENDACAGGTCVGPAVDCSFLNNACNVGMCNAINGLCELQSANEGGFCDDGLYCTLTDTCVSGICVGAGDPCPGIMCNEIMNSCVTCLADTDCNDVNICTNDACLSGGCFHTNNTLPCDDGLYCTLNDTCTGGACVGSGDPCPGVMCNEVMNSCVACLVDADCDDTNVCTDDACLAGSCFNMHNTLPCNDGLFCTSTDSCTGGACVGSGNPCLGQLCDETGTACVDCLADTDCDDGNTCTDDLCTAGVCSNTDNSAPCDDGLFCTLTDMCTTGICVGSGNPCPGQFCDETGNACVNCLVDADCNDGNVCTDDVCTAGVCSNTNNTVLCDDGDLCTESDVCSGGTCTGTAIDCSNLDDACNVGTCNAVNGLCEPQPTNENDSCDDGNLCSENDVCTLGVCAGTPLDCSSLDDICNLGMCNPTTGICEPMPANEGGPCDDADACTENDACVSGSCAGAPIDCSGLDDTCNVSTCNATSGLCEALPANEGGACDDGDPCTENDACTGGTCAGSLIDCSGSNSDCGTGVCNPMTGTCETTPIAEGDPCDDGNVCTTNDTCTGGSCVGTLLSGCDPCTTAADCNDMNVCTEDFCHPAGVCVHNNIVITCDDADPCTENDTCSAGVCGGASILRCTNCTVNADCNDSNVCTIDTCVGGTCDYTPDNGVSCNDDNVCTSSDTCMAGTCAGTPLAGCDSCAVNADCLDGNPCTNDICHPIGVCIFINNELGCDDDDPCTQTDTCMNGSCVSTPTVEGGLCDDGSICTTGETCQGGFCVGFPANEGASCDDTDVCTFSEICENGACVGVPLNCTTLDTDCRVGVCNSMTGACEPMTINESGPCDDGNLCTENDTCATGVCSGTTIDCSGLDDTCNVGTCNGISGLCELTPANEGVPCDDSSLCTSNDVCASGVCTGDALDCSSLDDTCNAGVCNPASGLCEVQPANEGDDCDDDDLCTENDACIAGVCDGTPIDCSAFIDACNDAVCNQATGVCDVTLINDGGGCDDGNLCTSTDTCNAGLCDGIPLDCSLLDDACNFGVCNETTGACETTPGPDGADCDDINPCTLNDTCNAGTCSGTDRNCSGLDGPCSAGACNAGTGLCQAVPANEGVSCTNANLCETSKMCTSGQCIGTPKDCSAFTDTCNVGTCNPVTGSCRATHANQGGSCDDGFPCTSGDACDDGECLGTSADPRQVHLTWSPTLQSVMVGSPVQISLIAISNTCVEEEVGSIETVVVWDPSFLRLDGRTDTGPFSWATSAFPNDSSGDGLNAPYTGIPGNDGDAFYLALAGFTQGPPVGPAGLVVTTFRFTALAPNISGTIVAIVDNIGGTTQTTILGQGIGEDITGSLGSATINIQECLSSTDCNDGNPCTNNACSGGICTFPNNTALCDDGLFCTTNDACSGGVCVGGFNSCPGQLCNEDLNACVECLVDGDCNDGNFCTMDTCNASGSCVFTNNSLPCNDGFFCTAADTCSGGSCVGSGDPCPGEFCEESLDSCIQCLNNGHCNDGNVCTTDSCVANACLHTSNSLPCNDGAFCTLNDACSGGVCTGSGNPCPGFFCNESFDSCVQCLNDSQCDDGNLCTDDACIAGSCFNTDNIRPCDDGLFCTAADACSGGMCVGTGNPCPGQLCDETHSACVDCFGDSDCDDGFSCTTDTCVGGTCVLTPGDGLCNDVLFCTGTETCEIGRGCVATGDPCGNPALCVESTDTCTCEAPTVLNNGSRYLAVTPALGIIPVALRVDLPASGFTCPVLYITEIGELSDTPVFLLPNEWGTVYVSDVEIEPGTLYMVESDCRLDPGDSENRSPSVSASTSLWADMNGSKIVDIDDVVYLLDRFGTAEDDAGKLRADIMGCLTNRTVDIDDVLALLAAFGSEPYSCPEACP